MLPDMSGYDVCRFIRQNSLTALLPIIMVSAAHEDRLAGIEAGADDLLLNPSMEPYRRLVFAPC